MGDFKILENLEKSVTKIRKPLPIWNILDLGTGKNDLSYKNEITDKKRRMATQKKQMEGRTVNSRAKEVAYPRPVALEPIVLEDMTCGVLVEDFFSLSPRLPISRFILWAVPWVAGCLDHFPHEHVHICCSDGFHAFSLTRLAASRIPQKLWKDF